MSKSKAKSPKKEAPKSGLIMKNATPGGQSKFNSATTNKSFSSKKGNTVNNIPRKTQ